MKTYEVLEKALALIEDEKNWTKGELESPSGAVCLNGALCRVVTGKPVWEEMPDDGYLGGRFGLDDLARSKGIPDLVSPVGGLATAFINDQRSHAEVLEFLREAIRNEKAKEGIPVSLPPTVLEEVVA